MGDHLTNTVHIFLINLTPLLLQPLTPSGSRLSRYQVKRSAAFVPIGLMIHRPGRITVSVMVLSTNLPHLILPHKMDSLNEQFAQRWTTCAPYSRIPA